MGSKDLLYSMGVIGLKGKGCFRGHTREGFR